MTSRVLVLLLLLSGCGASPAQPRSYRPVSDQSGALALEVPGDLPDLLGDQLDDRAMLVATTPDPVADPTFAPSVTVWASSVLAEELGILPGTRLLERPFPDAVRALDDHLGAPRRYAPGCRYVRTRPFAAGPYRGFQHEWDGCGASGATMALLGLVSADRDAVVVVEVIDDTEAGAVARRAGATLDVDVPALPRS